MRQLSIIVPIYNVERYIEKCANSLLLQSASPSNYEVIFVNDGTTDNSINVLKNCIDFSKLDNFKLVEKQNGGLSSARNFGLSYSSGEYIWFVDSDDWIEYKSVEILLSLMVEKPEVIMTSQMFRNTNQGETLKYSKSYNTKLTGIGVLELLPPTCSVMYICRRNFLDKNSFRFLEGICFEDTELIPRLLFKAKTVICTDVPLYHHYMREGSITQNITEKKVNDMMIVVNNHITFYKNIDSPEYKKIYSKNLSGKIIELLDYSMLAIGKKNKELDRFLYTELAFRQILLSSNHLPTKLLGCILVITPSYITRAFSLLRFLQNKLQRVLH